MGEIEVVIRATNMTRHSYGHKVKDVKRNYQRNYVMGRQSMDASSLMTSLQMHDLINANFCRLHVCIKMI